MEGPQGWRESVSRPETRGGVDVSEFGDARLPERFWSKVEVYGTCWMWTGCLDRSGYGRFGLHRSNVSSHRLAYESLVGAIGEGLQIDHLCRVRRCVNPSHLEPVTLQENIRRGDTGKTQRSKTHCIHGHPFDGDNLYVNPSSGHRTCRKCRSHRQRARLDDNPDTRERAREATRLWRSQRKEVQCLN